MFAIALALLGAITIINVTSVKSTKACNDPVHQHGNWTLHDTASGPSSVILEDASPDTASSLILDDFRIECPSGHHIGALVPVEGESPKQYALQFVEDDAQLPEGAIYYVKCLGRQPDALRT
ncbi:uncharacterized protein SCHCODRAFT_02751210 [Schizophyllum commune H4-8]|nr:uncharacterized protein SCHCODRAFT_02751210 [Schizophyllum commune H4-8]KAI5889702.1 hypothetical protein SCHCODRAFT_02751210 [Schizophyllum commune H4-8]